MSLTCLEEEQLKAEINKYDPANASPRYLILSLRNWSSDRIECARAILESLGCDIAPQRANGIDVNHASDEALEWAGVPREKYALK